MRKFDEFLLKGTIRRISPDKSRARSLIEESERKNRSLKQILDKIGLNDENANDIIEYCYDILIGLVRAKLYLDGFKSSGEGAHEAEVSYLSQIGFSSSELRFMDELRYFRNGIKYYGKYFDREYANKVLDFLSKVCLRLKIKM